MDTILKIAISAVPSKELTAGKRYENYSRTNVRNLVAAWARLPATSPHQMRHGHGIKNGPICYPPERIKKKGMKIAFSNKSQEFGPRQREH